MWGKIRLNLKISFTLFCECGGGPLKVCVPIRDLCGSVSIATLHETPKSPDQKLSVRIRGPILEPIQAHLGPQNWKSTHHYIHLRSI